MKSVMNLFKRTHKATAKMPLLPDSDIAEVREYAINGWKLDDTHGLPHWERVEHNGILLSTKDGRFRDNINIKVVRFFAYLHDKCRYDNGGDIGHGMRAADMLYSIRNTVLRNFTDEEFELLEKACRYHTIEHRTGNPTIDVCFDADRLDLGRVGIVPDSERMATEQGAYYAENLYLVEKMNKKK